MQELENFHLIKVEYRGAGDKTPASYKLTSERFKNSVTVSRWLFADEKELRDLPASIMQKMGFDVVGQAEGKNGTCYIITRTFKKLSINDLI